MTLNEGTLLQGGKYKIIRFINSGGFGCTYEAVHTLMDTKVAIKEFFVKNSCKRDESTHEVSVAIQDNHDLVLKLKKKFLDEAKAIYNMQHQNIIRVTDVFEENGTAYYVMDFVEGSSLHDIVKSRGCLSEQEASGYIIQVANALSYVHGLNRLHLDIKPGNIMLDKNGIIKLIDFGTSKHYDSETGENTSTLLGVNTKGYAPVEQTTMSFSKFSPATDIYSLGATFYKLLSGITPPDANLLMIQEEVLVPLSSSISDDTKRVIHKAMLPKRKDRYQSIAEFMSDWNLSIKNVGNENTSETSGKKAGRNSSDEDATQVEYRENNVKKANKRTFKVKGVSFSMILVEGATLKLEFGQEVDITDFYLAETQVTQNLWKAVMGDNPSEFKDCLDNPVEHISWSLCQAFIIKLNNLSGLTFRIPTKEEWIFAERGGVKSKGYSFSGGNRIEDVAWCSNNSHTKESFWKGKSGFQTHPVATKKPNELGLFDMTGNVWEWCYNPQNKNKYLMGGSFKGGTNRSCFNVNEDSNFSIDDIGIRLVLDNN